jgi:glycosyltransferase involved in cell wall biosynthesis
MRRVLFLAYHFPPVGGAGVQRAVKFVRYLPECGWEPVVVTGPVGSYGDDNLEDPTLADELPPDVEVRRVAAREPQHPGRWRARAERWLRLRPAWDSWWQQGAVNTGAAIVDADVIFATMSPFASCDAAAALSRRLGIPWVADLRDPWALDQMVVYPTGLHWRLERRRMRSALATAARVVMNTHEAGVQVVKAFPELRGRVDVIPNGFDLDDFRHPTPSRLDDSFRLVHTGELHTELGLRHRGRSRLRRLLGGSPEGVDFLARSHVFLVEAVERLARRRPELGKLVEIHLAGGVREADLASVPSSRIVVHGYVSHAEAVQLMRSADLLFLPLHDVPPPRRARIVPGKTYEYLASGRPVLAALPDGDARDLLLRAGSATLCRPTDVRCLERAVEGQLERALRGEPPAAAAPEVLAALERRRLTHDLAAVLDSAVAERGGTLAVGSLA